MSEKNKKKRRKEEWKRNGYLNITNNCFLWVKICVCFLSVVLRFSKLNTSGDCKDMISLKISFTIMNDEESEEKIKK